MKIQLIVLAATGMALAAASSASANSKTSAEAIDQITKAADTICVKAATGGSSSEVVVSANVKAELDHLLRKLADLGIKGDAKYQAESHEGVLATQVLDAAKESNQCKLHVFDVLTDKLIEKQASSPAPSPQDAYLVATHPTNVQIAKPRFERWVEDRSVPYLTLDLNNSSDIPALGLTVDILDPTTGGSFAKLKAFKTTPSNVLRISDSKTLGVAAKSTTSLPVISLDEIKKLVHHDIPEDFCAYDASLKTGYTPEEDAARQEAMVSKMREEIAAGTLDDNVGQMKTAQTIEDNIIVRIRYATIFHQKTTSYVRLFVYYAKRGSDNTLWYPSRQSIEPLQCVADNLPTLKIGQ